LVVFNDLSCFFFFSSRRRHTRFSRDWSSDVCSSDLVYRLYRRTVEDDTGELTDVTLVASFKGGVSGGTVDSARAMMEAVAEDGSDRKSVVWGKSVELGGRRIVRIK